MENKFNGGGNHQESRSDYGRENRTSYTAEGRKLRPRRKAAPTSGQGEHRPSYRREGSPYDRNSDRNTGYRRSSFHSDRPQERDRREGDGRERDYRERDHRDGERRPFNRDRRPSGERRPYGDRNSEFRKPGFSGPRKSARPRKDNYSFPKREEGGINQMLKNKPRIDDSYKFSDNDNVPTPIKEVERLNKFIANSGICSRREADTYIQAGVVTVNGEVVTELGTKVNVLTDDVRFNGERLKGEEKVYIVMNKPRGFVTTASDPHAEKTVMDLLRGCKKRVFPVGRLDKNTTGVLMFTNDGEMAEQLTHPSFNKKKIYQVILDKALEEADKEKILSGLELNDGLIKADELEYIDAEDHRRLGIEIHSGKNRIVRRIFESLGYTVKALDRVYFAGLTKKGLQKGEWRFLSEGEVNILKMGAYV